MAFKRNDEILVVDLETTCWEKPQQQGSQTQDIIEIGITSVLVKNLVVSCSESILVKPERSKVSEFCTKLTTITQDMLDKDGVSFIDAINKLQSMDSKFLLWASWGDFDRKMFERQCRDLNLPYPFGPRHLNVKTLFATAYGLPREVGMDKALEILNMPLDGTHHRGVDDSKNIAKILVHMLKKIRG